MKIPSWQITLRVVSVLVWLVSIVWLILDLGPEPLITFLICTDLIFIHRMLMELFAEMGKEPGKASAQDL